LSRSLKGDSGSTDTRKEFIFNSGSEGKNFSWLPLLLLILFDFLEIRDVAFYESHLSLNLILYPQYLEERMDTLNPESIVEVV